MSWPWPKVISRVSRSQCTYTENLCTGHNSSLQSWIWIIFHTLIVHDPRVCLDLYPRSYLQGKDHSAHIPQICAQSLTPHCHAGSGYFTQFCPWPKGVSWPWPKVISRVSRSQCTYTENLRPGHNSSLQSWIWIIFHTLIVHDPRVCHDLYPRSYLQGKDHSAHIPQICVQSLTPHCHAGSGYFTQFCPWPKDVSWPWPKVISRVSRSQCTYTENLCPGHNSSLQSWIWIIFHTLIVHDPRVCHDLYRKSYL